MDNNLKTANNLNRQVKGPGLLKILIVAVIAIVIIIVVIYAVAIINNKINPQPASKSAPAANDLPADFKTMYGLDPNKIDTDGDGISDKDEINLYQTNPLKPDNNLNINK